MFEDVDSIDERDFIEHNDTLVYSLLLMAEIAKDVWGG